MLRQQTNFNNAYLQHAKLSLGLINVLQTDLEDDRSDLENDQSYLENNRIDVKPNQGLIDAGLPESVGQGVYNQEGTPIQINNSRRSPSFMECLKYAVTLGLIVAIAVVARRWYQTRNRELVDLRNTIINGAPNDPSNTTNSVVGGNGSDQSNVTRGNQVPARRQEQDETGGAPLLAAFLAFCLRPVLMAGGIDSLTYSVNVHAWDKEGKLKYQCNADAVAVQDEEKGPVIAIQASSGQVNDRGETIHTSSAIGVGDMKELQKPNAPAMNHNAVNVLNFSTGKKLALPQSERRASAPRSPAIRASVTGEYPAPRALPAINEVAIEEVVESSD